VALDFEWDPLKAATNEQRHRISFKEASTVFGDTLSSTIEDPDHSLGERRFLTMGISVHGNLLVISHTERRGVIRIISARKATRPERRIYERS